MKNKFARKVAALGASIFSLIAMATAVSACTWFLYQPEEPKCIREK